MSSRISRPRESEYPAMPVASLLTMPVMSPGPMTARKSVLRSAGEEAGARSPAKRRDGASALGSFPSFTPYLPLPPGPPMPDARGEQGQ